MDTSLTPSATINRKLLIKTNSLQKPEVIGVYSSEKLSETDAEIRLDAFHCKYFRRELLAKENWPIDLKVYDERRKDYENKHSEYSSYHQPMVLFLEYLQKFVLQDNFVRFDENKLFKTDFICHVRVLIKMMMIHGDSNETLSLLCTKYKGNIYLLKRSRTHEHRKESMKVIARHALFADKPNTDVNTNDPAITKFHCVFKWQFCDANVTYFSGIQGVDSDEIMSETDLSKIKVARIKTKFNDVDEMKRSVYQSPYWWGQSLLLGNADIHEVNIRDDGEAIENINTIGVDTFLHTYERRWRKSSDERVSFLKLILELIKLRMTFVDSPFTVYEFEFDPKNQKTVHYNTHHGRNELTFLTDKYINAMEDL